jgi:hypothetical protein
MASTYVNDLRLNEMATGDQSGSWGTVTNTNLELIGEAFSYGTETIGDADSTLTIADGASDPVRSFFLKITSSVDLTTTRIVTIAPNTVSKVWMIENATTGSQIITIKQGSGATINVPNGQVKMISTDGAGSGAAVTDLLVDVDLTGTTTLVNLDVSGAVDIAGDLTLSAGGDGALRFTAASSVKVLDNDAAALVFEEADNAYMTFVTTDGSEAVKFDKALDINGATQIDATVTVGVDDTGYDVKFFGATTGKSLLWDESADSLIVTGTTTLVGTTNLDVVDIDGATQIDATVTVGVDDTGYDVKFFGATAGAYMLWDESADDLILGGAAGLSVNSTALVTGVLTANGGAVFNESGADVDFRVESDTDANALFVEGSSGNVGIGTSSPAYKLQIGPTEYQSVNTSLPSITDTATIYRGTPDGTGFEHAKVFSGRDATTWSYGSYLSFYTEGKNTGTTDTSAERMRIDSSGNVLVGTTSTTGTAVVHIPATSSKYAISFRGGSTTSAACAFYNSAGGGVGEILIGASSTTYSTSSDYRLKTDAQPMTGASDRVLALKPVNFEWISTGDRVDGFLAHEAQTVVPECVTGTKDAMRDEQYEVTAAVEATYDEDSNELTAAVPAVMGTRSVPDYQGIDQSKLVPLLTAALQEALTEISALGSPCHGPRRIKSWPLLLGLSPS